MKFEVLAITATSITIELKNTAIYKVDEAYDIYINDVLYSAGNTKNVTSVFGLQPDEKYAIKCIQGDEEFLVEFNTKYEYVSLNVKKFGALGDGEHIDSTAIQTAIMACPKDGRVYLPKGRYLCTPLFLKSDITIELAEGAVILGHTDYKQYPILPGYTITSDEKDEYYLGTWEGNPLDQFACLITGIGVQNVSIIGKGTIDGNADQSDWWEYKKTKRIAWRPRTVFLNNCENVLLQGVTVKNSPSWTIHPYLSKNLSFFDIKIQNDKNSPNTDGLDPESCDGVKIVGIEISVGDDCIAIKAGKLYMGKRLKKATENMVIRNCHMVHGHGAVVLGSEMSGGVKNLKVSQCLFEHTDRGLRIKTRRGRGEDAIIDNIVFEDIQMNHVQTPFVINMFYFCDPDGKTEYVWSKEALPVDEWTPYLGSFRFSRINAVNSEVASAYFMGLPEQPIKEVLMEDIHVSFLDETTPGRPAMMSYADPVQSRGIVAHYVDTLTLKNVNLQNIVGEELEAKAVPNIKQV